MTRIKLAVTGLVTLVAIVAATAAQAGAVDTPGAVYVLSNGTAGNAVIAYDRTSSGALIPAGKFSTGGNGTGAGLGDQGALAAGRGGHVLYAVNAGSNTVSALEVTGNGLRLADVEPTGGVTPISVTVHDKLVFVLNGGSNTITGFAAKGKSLVPIAGSTRSLSAGAAGAAQVEFSPDGRFLAVTEKASNTIDTFAVDDAGQTSAAVSSAAVGATPFGFDFDRLGHLLTSNASGSASSYAVDANGAQVISGSVATNQAAPCWLIVGGNYAYTANAGAGSISRFAIGSDGSLTLLDSVAASTGAGSHPLDLAVSSDGRYLYNLTDGQHRITVWSIASDGSLSSLESIGDLPAGAEGIVAV